MNRILSNISISPLNYSYISYEFHFAPETILGEVRIRSVRILIGLGLTWFTRYWFPEKLISPLAKPFGQNQTDFTKKSLSERLSREIPPIPNLIFALSWDNQLKWVS